MNITAASLLTVRAHSLTRRDTEPAHGDGDAPPNLPERGHPITTTTTRGTTP